MTRPPWRVRLRRVRADDLARMARIESDETLVGEHNWPGAPVDPDDREAELRRRFVEDGMWSTTAGRLVVEVDGEPVGEVSWRPEKWGPSERSRCLAFGISLLPDHRGKGYGTEAQRLLIDHLFAATETHRVQSDTAVDNPAEQRSLEKAGMRREGIVRGAEHRRDAYHDHVLYGILRTDWEPLEDAPPIGG